jgi:hypothetical protein
MTSESGYHFQRTVPPDTDGVARNGRSMPMCRNEFL